MINSMGSGGYGGGYDPAPQAAAPSKKNDFPWPDALIGLAQFIASRQRSRPQAPGQSFGGIGQPSQGGQGGPLTQLPQRQNVPVPGSLGQYL